MILYLDTSALVKKYFRENGSDEVISKWKTATAIATSSVAYAEAMAAFYRKKRESDIQKNQLDMAIQLFQKDWNSFICVEVSNELNDVIDRFVATHPLRGFDAIHLASAYTLQQAISDTFIFACFDMRLSQAAQAEGITSFPE